MFTRAPGGADMIADFKPFMRPEKVTEIQGYFLTIGSAEGDLRLHVLPDAAAGRGRRRPRRSPQLNEPVAGRISGEMAPMIGTMADNVDRFAGIAALPPFWALPLVLRAPGRARHRLHGGGGPLGRTRGRYLRPCGRRTARTLRSKERDMTTTHATPTANRPGRASLDFSRSRTR